MYNTGFASAKMGSWHAAFLHILSLLLGNGSGLVECAFWLLKGPGSVPTISNSKDLWKLSRESPSLPEIGMQNMIWPDRWPADTFDTARDISSLMLKTMYCTLCRNVKMMLDLIVLGLIHLMCCVLFSVLLFGFLIVLVVVT